MVPQNPLERESTVTSIAIDRRNDSVMRTPSDPPEVVALLLEHHLAEDGGDGGPHHGSDDDSRGGDGIGH